MSYPQPPMTRQYPPPVPTPPRNGLGTAGFVLGLVGLLFSFIPLVGVIAWPLVVLGLVLGGLGLAKAARGQANDKGLAVAGIALSAVGLVICILWAAVFGKAASEASDALDNLEAGAGRESVLVYEVTSDAPVATVSYTTFSDSGSATSDEELTSFPWTKEFKVEGFLSGGTLTVMTGAEGGTVTCKITVDGVEKKTATGTGEYATVNCSDF
ncbi:MmpS family transport accessory protein [Saccharothrix deserti]|uniref:MmpS family transport accessory protein n=1 Tax=Saccharothrix deserti TaxID=2593674 RepID=UPI00131C8D80|nr:MmpS family transport accessory protein [Saccharothrix deserti]